MSSGYWEVSNMDYAGDDDQRNHDNGTAGGEPGALKTDSLFLAEALEGERRKVAALSTKLKKAQAKNRQLEYSLNDENNDAGFMRRHSTMRETSTTVNDSLSATTTGLSYALMNIPECKPGEDEDDIDRKSFEHWKDLLEASMQLMGVHEEHVKMSIFNIKSGPKLLDVLEGAASSKDTPSAELAPYSNAMARLKNYFGSRDYALLQRQKLRSVTQSRDESAVKFVKCIIAI